VDADEVQALYLDGQVLICAQSTSPLANRA
jgi:hypothetical protein